MAKVKNVKWQWWVLGGVGVAGGYYVHKRNQDAKAAAVPEDTALSDASTYDPNYSGYGTATLGGYTDPGSGQFITPGTGIVVTSPSTNAAWAQQAVAYLSTQGYNPLTVVEALGRYLAGATLSDSQLGIVQAAIAVEGLPPQSVPPPHTAPPSGQPGGSGSGAHKYEVQLHKLSAQTSLRSLVQRFSDPGVANNNTIQVAVAQTASDPRNAKYLTYFSGHGGAYPPMSTIYTHVVKSA
jgi:hypothetical protein